MRHVLILSLVVAVGTVAAAGNIPSGFDVFKTQPSAFWDFSLDPVVADFFGPGSDPFEGQIHYITDTKVLRPFDVNFLTGPVETVPVEIVSLSLHSTEPIRVTYDDGAVESFFDVFMTIDPAVGPNTGQHTLQHNDVAAGEPDGGWMIDSFFDVFFEFDFTNPETGESRTLQRRQLLTLVEPVPWSHTAPPRYDHGLSGGFFLGVDFAETLPDDLYVPMTLRYQGSEFTWDFRLAAIPEPATFTLLVLGGVWRRRHRDRT